MDRTLRSLVTCLEKPFFLIIPWLFHMLSYYTCISLRSHKNQQPPFPFKNCQENRSTWNTQSCLNTSFPHSSLLTSLGQISSVKKSHFGCNYHIPQAVILKNSAAGQSLCCFMVQLSFYIGHKKAPSSYYCQYLSCFYN